MSGLRPIKPLTDSASREQRAEVAEGVRASLVHLETNDRVSGWVRNMSLGGLYLESEQHYQVGDPVQVEALVRDGDSVHTLKASGWVARVDENGMGVQLAVLQPDAAATLERLIHKLLENSVISQR